MPANPKLFSEVHPGTETFVLVSAVNFKKHIEAYNSVFYVTSCRLVATRYSNSVITDSRNMEDSHIKRCNLKKCDCGRRDEFYENLCKISKIADIDAESEMQKVHR